MSFVLSATALCQQQAWRSLIVSPYCLLPYSIKYTVPGGTTKADDGGQLSAFSRFRSCFSVQLLSFGTALELDFRISEYPETQPYCILGMGNNASYQHLLRSC